MHSPKNRRERPGFFTVRLTTVSVVLLCITVSSVASLAVVATITKADALSTVALALAVLAFAAQLIVTLAQSQATANQTRDTFRINAETRSLLTEIKAQSSALVTLQSNQFDKLLSRLLDPSVLSAAITNSTEDESGGSENSQTASQVDPVALADELKRLIAEPVETVSPRVRVKGFPATSSTSESTAFDIVRDFRDLTSEAQDLMVDLADKAMRREPVYISEGDTLPDGFQELRKRRFITLGPLESDRRRVLLMRRGGVIRELRDTSNPISWAPRLSHLIERELARRNNDASASD